MLRGGLLTRSARPLHRPGSQTNFIVVDDGSSDRTLEIARLFESKSVCIVTQENQGAAAARNKALSLSVRETTSWLDADDLLVGQDYKGYGRC